MIGKKNKHGGNLGNKPVRLKEGARDKSDVGRGERPDTSKPDTERPSSEKPKK